MPETEPSAPGRGRHGRRNLQVLGALLLGWPALLTLVDCPRLPWLLRAPLVVLFCLGMQGVFSLMHESFHQNAHHDRRLNYLIGLLGGLVFGTSVTLHRVHHWGHHRRNRTEAERSEFIHPGESPIRKVLLYYFAVLGGLWLGGAVFPFVALLLPYGSARVLARSRRFNTYAAAFDQFHRRDWTLVRLEALALGALWTSLVMLGPWRWQTLTLCYGAFALTWSSLQWVYHLRTPLDAVEGAYNLRAPWLVRVLFLNFNYNLTHHRYPSLPWQELPAYTDLQQTQPLHYRWVRMLEPPVRLPEEPAVLTAMLAKRYF